MTDTLPAAFEGVSTVRRTTAGGLMGLLLAGVSAVAASCQTPSSELVVTSDPALGELAAALLPDLAERSGLELRAPVRLEMRSREQLVRYLESKLDEELPEEEARATVDAYSLLGLVPADMDLRAVLLALYTEQVAGFYDPDSTALFVMDDQPQATLQGLLVHELVHAVQDQWADLDAITDPSVGNDRATAAQAAIEGHATLVMLEYMTEQMQGSPVDLASIPNFADRIRPALQGMRAQFPALASAPTVIQEALLFPYLEGAGFVQKLWVRGARVAPFGEHLPASTEQILRGSLDDVPVELTLDVEGARVAHEDVLGRLEIGILLDEHLGAGSATLAEPWGGDRYVLVERSGGGRALIWYSVWESEAGRDAFADALASGLGSFGGPATVERASVGGSPATVVRIGDTQGISVSARLANAP